MSLTYTYSGKASEVPISLWPYRIELMLRGLYGGLDTRPPPLQAEYSRDDFIRFMEDEVFHFSRRYARRRVRIRHADRLREVAASGGAILAFVHYGSFFLFGGAIVHQLGLPYTAVATRHNLNTKVLSLREIFYWLYVHEQAGRLYKRRLIFTDESPYKSINWLRSGNLLGMALDVRELGQGYKESRFKFMEKDIYMQFGPARVAACAGVPVVPVSIRYDLASRCHDLNIGAPVKVTGSAQQATQALLDSLSEDPMEQPEQLFHDIPEVFRTPDHGADVV